MDKGVQGRIIRHSKRKNASGRVEMFYWVVPKGDGSYAVNNGSFLSADQINPRTLRWYRRVVGLAEDHAGVGSSEEEQGSRPMEVNVIEAQEGPAVTQATLRNLFATKSTRVHLPLIHKNLYLGAIETAYDPHWLAGEGIRSMV